MGSLASPSTTEIVLPLSSQKHDPAWKHCLMIKKGEKTHLKCMYCLKIFSGGGIHRIKEHLACQKGNASCCVKVLPEVRDAMRESLEGVAMRKRKKQRLVEEVKMLNPVSQSDTQVHADPDVCSTISSFPADLIDQASLNPRNEDAPAAKVYKRGRKKRAKVSPVSCLLVPSRITDVPTESAPGYVSNRDQVCKAIGHFLYEAGVPLDAVKSVHFRSMIDAIVSAGPGFEPPSYHDIRGWILKSTLDEMAGKLQQLKGTWARNGCSILADEWITETNRTLINFLVYCSEGTVFLKCVDASEIVASADAFYELLRDVVEEVGVRDVVQIITSNSDTHALAGKMLMETFPTMFWTPCCVQCVDSILMDFSKLEEINSILEKAQQITSFMYNHAPIINMMKKHTGGRELVHPFLSSAATTFLSLRAMVSLEDNLRMMMTSKEWMGSAYSKMPGSLSVVDLICNPMFWSSCSTIVKLTEPLLRAMSIADSGTKPAMGYIYMIMRFAKQRIKQELKRKEYYMPYWDIIDRRCDKKMQCALHTAGFFLNPRFFYKMRIVPSEIMSGMLDCVEKLVPEAMVQDKINKELSLYKNATGDFGRKMAIRARETLLPAEWWSTYGGGCPNLARLAIRILNQTCSAAGHDRHNIPFEQLHSQRKNSLEKQRFDDLIFVRYNLRLQQRPSRRNRPSDPISMDNCIGHIEDWLIEKNDFLPDGISSSWMELNQPVGNGWLSEYANAEDDDLFLNGFGGEDINSLCNEDEDADEIMVRG